MNQHYVPKVYLKHFSRKKKKSFFIDVYDKTDKRYFPSNINGICSEKDLYTLEENTEIAKDKLAVENLYSRFIEPTYARCYQILTDKNKFNLTALEHIDILIGVFQLYFRNPKWITDSLDKHRINLSANISKSLNKDSKKIEYLNKEYDLKTISVEEIMDEIRIKLVQEFKENHFVGTQEICQFHSDAKIEVNHLVDGSSFITGDNPLISKDIITNHKNPFLRSKNFTLSINSKTAVRIYHDKRAEPYKIIRTKTGNGTAHSYNEAVIKNSVRFILGDKNDIIDCFNFRSEVKTATGTIEKRIEIYKQIMNVAKQHSHGKETIKIIKSYLAKYESTGNLTPDEEQEMYRKLKVDSNEYLKKIIKK